MNHSVKGLIPFFIFILMIYSGCRKKVEVLYVSNEKVTYDIFSGISLIGDFPSSSPQKAMRDTVIANQIDINKDGSFDLKGFLEVFHVDTMVYVKSYLKRINPELELLNKKSDTLNFLTAFNDNNSYVTPNPDQWPYAPMNEEYLMNTYRIFKCNVGGAEWSCIDRTNGFFIPRPDKQFYFFGFRLKSKKSANFNTFWNYGYVQISSPGSSLAISIVKIAIENNTDRPILMANNPVLK